MKKCSPNEQVELYLKSASSTIPPNNDLIDTLASEGADVIPALVSRIERSGRLEDELYKPELLFVLVWMQDHGYYAVARDEKLMRRLERAVLSIPEPELKEAAEQTLGWLKEPKSRRKAR